MKVSYSWLKELVDFVEAPRALGDLLTARGLEVEEFESQSKGLEKVVSAFIVEKGKHPDSDRLSLCKVDVGQAHGGVLEIVCGATNHKTGDKVAAALVGADLPNGMKIGKGKIRGVESNGMLCSEAELGISKESAGIIILPKDTPVGKPIAEILGRDDSLLTLKLYANQGHYLSHFGVAREIAAATGKPAKRPAAVAGGKPVALDWKGSPISIALEAGEKAPQFYGCQIDGVKIGPSPAWLVKRLEAVGSRSINNVVDATNLVMLELGHPVHAYDADKIASKKIGVRMSKAGEKFPLLDDSEVTMGGAELVIFDGSGKAIGLAGVMGGGNSEVSDGTTKVFLECAEFDPVLVRKAKTKHGKLTDAATRFERGVDPKGLPAVMNRLAALVLELAGGKIVGSAKAEVSAPKARPTIEMPVSYVRDFIGVDVKDSEVESTLRALECDVEKKGDTYRVKPPSYRLDLNLREDLAEEVARSVGYDRIPSTIPKLSSPPIARAFDADGAQQILLERAKDAFVRQGVCEALNYGFTSATWLANFGLTGALKVQNPMSEEHEWMVPSLVPGLVGNALRNYRHHFGSESPVVRLFEIRPTFALGAERPKGADGAPSKFETGVNEEWKIAFALSGPRYAQALRNEVGEVDFYDGKAILEAFLDQMGAKGIRFIPLHASRNPNHPGAKLLHPGQAIEVLAGNATLGHFGLLHPGTAKKLKIKENLFVGELDWATLSKMCRAASQARTFKPWSEQPPIERDFAILAKAGTTADQVLAVLNKAGKPLVKSAKIFDVYQGAQVAAGKVSIGARVILQDETRALTEAEAEGVSKTIVAALAKELGAELR
ncbi:MAG: phenylalanine--tRNA ligase subunit beta [Bdellovibrionales bacterium]|nr:phenylalanine--tRNA ligase subunit beta [Bdellovibrionales bacterium]